MRFHRSWICDGVSKDGKHYPGGYKPHKPHENHGAYCEICWKPRAAMIPKKSSQRLPHHVGSSSARLDLSRQLLLSTIQFLLVLGVPILAVFLAVYTLSNFLLNPQIELSQIYENFSYGIKMKYPKGWQRQDQQDHTVTGDVAVIFPEGKNGLDRCQSSLTIEVDDFQENSPSVEEYKKSVIAKINTLNPNTKMTDESNPSTTLSNSSAYKLVYTRQEEKCSLQVMEVGTVKNNKAYYITYSSEPNQYDKFLKPAEEMIKSFEIVEVKK